MTDPTGAFGSVADAILFQPVVSEVPDDGVFVMSNYYRQGWVVGRLRNVD